MQRSAKFSAIFSAIVGALLLLDLGTVWANEPKKTDADVAKPARRGESDAEPTEPAPTFREQIAAIREQLTGTIGQLREDLITARDHTMGRLQRIESLRQSEQMPTGATALVRIERQVLRGHRRQTITALNHFATELRKLFPQVQQARRSAQSFGEHQEGAALYWHLWPIGGAQSEDPLPKDKFAERRGLHWSPHLVLLRNAQTTNIPNALNPIKRIILKALVAQEQTLRVQEQGPMTITDPMAAVHRAEAALTRQFGRRPRTPETMAQMDGLRREAQTQHSAAIVHASSVLESDLAAAHTAFDTLSFHELLRNHNELPAQLPHTATTPYQPRLFGVTHYVEKRREQLRAP